jgi:hypothetical protein
MVNACEEDEKKTHQMGVGRSNVKKRRKLSVICMVQIRVVTL